ncbi:hypothetical protein [Plantibacter sp. YIM 135347]|uniref:hypothetical protein n=1 Tax=Plantibacter sp. YIM 135347 TaxID=3423919 RepID=UPI003D3298EE
MPTTILPPRPQHFDRTSAHQRVPLDALVGHATRIAVPELTADERAVLAIRLRRAAQFAIDRRGRDLGRVVRSTVASLIDHCPDSAARNATHRALSRTRTRRLPNADDYVLAHVQLLSMAAAVAAGERGAAAIAASLAVLVVFG